MQLFSLLQFSFELPTNPICVFAGLIVAQAAEQLGQEVLLRHFLVTVQGRTGYLEPQWEDCSVTGNAASFAVLAPLCTWLKILWLMSCDALASVYAELMPLTYSQVGLDLTVKTDSPRNSRSGEWPRMVAITV